MYEALGTGEVQQEGDDSAFSRLFVAASRYFSEGGAGRVADPYLLKTVELIFSKALSARFQKTHDMESA
jgi:hypothetical protein